MTIRQSAIAVASSANKKIGIAAATYAAQGSCPRTCPLLSAGCYAESGHVGIATRQLAAAAAESSRADIAKTEAAAIDRLTGDRPLRLHVVGDSATNAAARTVSAAADRYSARTGAPVWTYTHAWRTVEHKSWGSVAVRASCESLEDVAAANARGYAAAIIVDEHPADGRAYQTAAGRVIPCPEQTRGRSCTDCRICWTSTNTVAFAAHGPRAAQVKQTIKG